MVLFALLFRAFAFGVRGGKVVKCTHVIFWSDWFNKKV